MRRLLRIVLTTLVLAYLALCATLFFFQRSLIYKPQPERANASAVISLPKPAEGVLVSTRPAHGPKALIYFGGNAEDTSLNLPSFSRAFSDTSLYLMNYRGYGGSSGNPTEQALFEDGLELFDLAHAEHPNVVVVGRSLGTGVATYVASQRPAARLVLVTPYDGLEEIAAGQYPYVPVHWLMLDKFESFKYAPRVTVPTLILAAENDETVPRASTERLLTRFRSGVAAMHVLPGTSHNTVGQSPEYLPFLVGDR